MHVVQQRHTTNERTNERNEPDQKNINSTKRQTYTHTHTQTHTYFSQCSPSGEEFVVALRVLTAIAAAAIALVSQLRRASLQVKRNVSITMRRETTSSRPTANDDNDGNNLPNANPGALRRHGWHLQHSACTNQSATAITISMLDKQQSRRLSFSLHHFINVVIVSACLHCLRLSWCRLTVLMDVRPNIHFNSKAGRENKAHTRSVQ